MIIWNKKQLMRKKMPIQTHLLHASPSCLWQQRNLDTQNKDLFDEIFFKKKVKNNIIFIIWGGKTCLTYRGSDVNKCCKIRCETELVSKATQFSNNQENLLVFDNQLEYDVDEQSATMIYHQHQPQLKVLAFRFIYFLKSSPNFYY